MSASLPSTWIRGRPPVPRLSASPPKRKCGHLPLAGPTSCFQGNRWDREIPASWYGTYLWQKPQLVEVGIKLISATGEEKQRAQEKLTGEERFPVSLGSHCCLPLTFEALLYLCLQNP